MRKCNKCGKNISESSVDSGKSKYFSDDDSRGSTFLLCARCSKEYIKREQERLKRQKEEEKKRKTRYEVRLGESGYYFYDINEDRDVGLQEVLDIMNGVE